MDLRAKKTFKDFYLQASIICLVSTWKPVEGGYDVIGASQPIRAAPGDDVILPCWVSPEWNATRKTVEWSRVNQNSSIKEYVLLYKGYKVDKDATMESYIPRVSLPGNLSVGNVSLNLINVTVNDSGSFKCFLPNLNKSIIVELIVDSSAPRNPNTSKYNWLHVLWVLLLPVGILVGLVGFYLFKKRKSANLGQNYGEGESSSESFLQRCTSVHHNPVKVHFS